MSKSSEDKIESRARVFLHASIDVPKSEDEDASSRAIFETNFYSKMDDVYSSVASNLVNTISLVDELVERFSKEHHDLVSRRKLLGENISSWIPYFIGFTFIIVFLNSIDAISLSDDVLTALIYAVTVGITSIYYFIIRYIFTDKFNLSGIIDSFLQLGATLLDKKIDRENNHNT